MGSGGGTELRVLNTCPLNVSQRQRWGFGGRLGSGVGSFLRGVQLQSALGLSRGVSSGDFPHCLSAERGRVRVSPLYLGLLSAFPGACLGLAWLKGGGLGPSQGSLECPEGIFYLAVGRAGCRLEWQGKSSFLFPLPARKLTANAVFSFRQPRGPFLTHLWELIVPSCSKVTVSSHVVLLPIYAE